ALFFRFSNLKWSRKSKCQKLEIFMRFKFDPQAFWDSIPSEDSPYWPAICIDFNGVIDSYTGWNGKVEDHPPAPNARWFLEEIRVRFSTVIILTATRPYTKVEDWFIKYE